MWWPPWGSRKSDAEDEVVPSQSESRLCFDGMALEGSVCVTGEAGRDF